jgi:hypothetical protein
MSLPRSRSHKGPTNPRNKPQTIPKRKRNSRSKGLRQSAVSCVDHPQGGGGLSAGTRRTVRELVAECPNMVPKPPVAHCKKWTVHPLPADRPRRADCPSSPRGPSAKPRATKYIGGNRSKRKRSRTRDEQEEHKAGRLHADYA